MRESSASVTNDSTLSPTALQVVGIVGGILGGALILSLVINVYFVTRLPAAEHLLAVRNESRV